MLVRLLTGIALVAFLPSRLLYDARHVPNLPRATRWTMGDIGLPELLIILAIIIVLFGANRVKGLGHALGSSIRE